MDDWAKTTLTIHIGGRFADTRPLRLSQNLRSLIYASATVLAGTDLPAPPAALIR